MKEFIKEYWPLGAMVTVLCLMTYAGLSIERDNDRHIQLERATGAFIEDEGSYSLHKIVRCWSDGFGRTCKTYIKDGWEYR